MEFNLPFEVSEFLREVFDGEHVSSCLVVSNIPPQLFDCVEDKNDFERIFLCYGNATFLYLKSFRRILVNFSTSESAALAKLDLHSSEFKDTELKIFFKKNLNYEGRTSLMPPAPEKQFLISPPASPPVGWQPIQEGIPVVNYDLLSAVAALALDEPHELHAPTHSTPAIVVHCCANPDPLQKDNYQPSMASLPRHAVQTSRPPMANAN